MRGVLATDNARKPSMMKQPAIIETRVTFTDPRILIHVALQIIANEMTHSTRASNPGDEIAQILLEQHRIDRHVHKGIHPREPAILKSPETPECPIDPAIITALFGQHAGELAYNERFRHRPDQG